MACSAEMARKRRRRPRPASADGPPRTPSAAPTAAAPEPAPAARAWQRVWWLAAPLIAVVAYRDQSSVDFVADARFLIADNRFAHALRFWKATLVHDYFWSSSGNIIPYWRPVTKLSWLVEWQAFHMWAGGFALVNLAWHAVGVAGVGALARRVGLSRAAAFAAALLYALHPVMLAPVSMIMARSDVVAATCMTWAVVAWLAWREGGPHRRAWAALHVGATLIALGSKETAIALPLVVTAWSLLERDRKRLWTLLPAVGLGVVYFIVRHALLEREATGLSATALTLDPVRLFSGLGAYLWNTFPLLLSSGVRDISLTEARGAAALARAAVAIALLAVLVTWAVRRRERAALALSFWVVAGVAPVLVARDISVIGVTGKVPLADRWLACSLGPALVVWVLIACRAIERFANARRPAIAAACVAGSWAVLMLVRSGADRAEFASDVAMLDNEDRAFYFAVPERYRTDEDRCRYRERKLVRALAHKQPDRVPALARSAVAICGKKPEVLADWLDALVELGRFRDAEPIARELSVHPPRDARSHGHVALMAGISFAESGEPGRAAPLLARAAGLGAISCAGLVPLAERARRARHPAVAATYVEAAYACGGGRDASLLLAGATWLVAAGDSARAARLIAALDGRALGDDQAAQRAALQRALDSGTPDAGIAQPVIAPK